MSEIDTPPPRDGDADLVLAAHGLSKWYSPRSGVFRKAGPARVHAVDDVHLELRRGETLGIVGESGCGKSSLARMLSLVEKPSAGRLEVLGQQTATLSGRRLRAERRHVQMVFQDPYTSLNPRQTVAQIVREPLDVHGDVVPRPDRARRVAELLELVGLNPRHAGRYPHQFSGGQRQRVGIARALALNPEVIVCDEPVSALDVSVQAQVINLLMKLQQELGLAYVFIAHDLSVVQHMAHRVAVMYLGRVVETGPAGDVYDDPNHPYTKALLSAVPELRRGDGSSGRIVLEGDVPSPVDPPSGCHFRTRCWMATERCAAASPPLTGKGSPSHLSACHHWEDVRTSRPLQGAVPGAGGWFISRA